MRRDLMRDRPRKKRPLKLGSHASFMSGLCLFLLLLFRLLGGRATVINVVLVFPIRLGRRMNAF
jgi:hypothetical protein